MFFKNENRFNIVITSDEKKAIQILIVKYLPWNVWTWQKSGHRRLHLATSFIFKWLPVDQNGID